jgi:hypothetical protein
MYFVEIPFLLNNDLIDKAIKSPGGLDFEEFEAWAVSEVDGKEVTIIYTKQGNEYITSFNEKRFKDWLFETIASYNNYIETGTVVSPR